MICGNFQNITRGHKSQNVRASSCNISIQMRAFYWLLLPSAKGSLCYRTYRDLFSFWNKIPLRPSKTGDIFRANCRVTILRCKLRWFVARINNFFSQQIFMWQKVDVAFTFCNMTICCARRWYKRSQLATQHCCTTSCTKNVACITGP